MRNPQCGAKRAGGFNEVKFLQPHLDFLVIRFSPTTTLNQSPWVSLSMRELLSSSSAAARMMADLAWSLFLAGQMLPRSACPPSTPSFYDIFWSFRYHDEPLLTSPKRQQPVARSKRRRYVQTGRAGFEPWNLRILRLTPVFSRIPLK